MPPKNAFSEKKASWLAVLCYMALIFLLSSFSPSPFFRQVSKYHTDWLVHSVEYGVLGALLIRAMTLNFHASVWLPAAALLVGALYAASDEWHQSFVPLRDASVYDWVADAIGLVAGIALVKKKLKPFGATTKPYA